MATAQKALLMLVPLFIGIMIGALINSIATAIDDTKPKRKSIIRLKRYRVGPENFSFNLFRINGSDAMLRKNLESYEVLQQIDFMQEYIIRIIGLVVAYDLKEFQTIETKATIQASLETFVANTHVFNTFMKQAEYVVANTYDEAIEELKQANQPALETVKKIDEAVVAQVANSAHQLIDFQQ